MYLNRITLIGFIGSDAERKRRKPELSSVALRAICSIHSEVGCLVNPARLIRRDSR